MRLIDADALIAELHNAIFEDGEDRTNVYRVIQGRPTISAQPEEREMSVELNDGVVKENERFLLGEIEELKSRIRRLREENERNKNDNEKIIAYRDGMIEGLKFAIRANGISGGEVKG